MKKYVLPIIIICVLFGFSSYAANYPGNGTGCTSTCNGKAYGTAKPNGCLPSCCKSSNVLQYGDEEVCCDEGEQLNQDGKCREACVGGTFYGRGGLSAGNNKCCPAGGVVYDKDSVTENYASCCEGKVYSDDKIYETTPSESELSATQDNNLKCCAKGSAIVLSTNGKNYCTSCSALKQEVISIGSMGPYTPSQQNKISEYPLQCGGSAQCDDSKKYVDEGGATKCCEGIVQGGKCMTNTEGNMGIDIDQDCLINGQCKFDIYQTLGIRQSLPRETRSSPGIFIQDIILSATFFVGTLVTGVLLISGFLFVFSAARPELKSRAKKGITGSLIGLLFVTGSYAFVRLIQFLITGGGG